MEKSKQAEVRRLLYRGELRDARKLVEAEIARIEDAEGDAGLWSFRFARAEILTLRGHVEEALEYLDSLSSPRPTDQESVATLRMHRGYCSGILGRNRVSHSLLSEAEDLARDAGLLRLLGEVLLCRAFIFFREKRYTTSSDLYRSTLKLSEQISDWYLRGHGHWGIGENLMIQCHYAEAMPWFEKANGIFQAHGARLSLSTVWSEMAVCYLGLGDDEKAMELLQKSQHVDHSAGLMHSYQVDLANIGNVYLHRRDYFTALSYYQRAVSLAREIKDPVSVKKWTYNINLAYARIKAAVDESSAIVAPESTAS